MDKVPPSSVFLPFPTLIEMQLMDLTVHPSQAYDSAVFGAFADVCATSSRRRTFSSLPACVLWLDHVVLIRSSADALGFGFLATADSSAANVLRRDSGGRVFSCF